jgi:hypothetical protein
MPTCIATKRRAVTALPNLLDYAGWLMVGLCTLESS